MTNGNSSVVFGVVYWGFSTSLSLSAGMHTIAVEGALTEGASQTLSPNAATISGDTNSVLQGQLTVVILKT